MPETGDAKGVISRPEWPSLLVGALLVSVLGACLSVILVQHHRDPSYDSAFIRALCGSSELSGCDLVNRSAAARFLGLPIAQWGFWFYGAVCVVSILAVLPGGAALIVLLATLAVGGLAVNAGLLAYSLLGLHAVCNLCLLNDAASAMIAALVVLEARRARRRGILDSLRPSRILLLERRQVPALAFGAIAVLVSGALVSASTRPTVERCAELFEEPDEALTIAWASFRNHYEKTAPVRIDVEDAPVKGTGRPLLDIVLFADFLCPHCRTASAVVNQFSERHRDKVRLVFKHYPLDPSCNDGVEGPIHEGACLLAKASYVALQRNKFWAFHDRLFANPDLGNQRISTSDVLALAAQLGLEAAEVEAGLASPKVEERIRRDVREANALDISGVPTLYLNGRRMKSIPVQDFLEELLRLEIRRRQPAPAQPSATPVGAIEASKGR